MGSLIGLIGCVLLSQLAYAANKTAHKNAPTPSQKATQKTSVSKTNYTATQQDTKKLTPPIAANAVQDTSQVVIPTATQPPETPSKTLPDYDTSINNGVPLPPSYILTVPSYLTLEQAQQYFAKVSPKVAADNALIVSNEQTEQSTKDLDKPVIYLGAGATHVHIDEKIDTTGIKQDLSNTINDGINHLPVPLPLPPVNVGELITDPLPNRLPINTDKNRVGANVTVMWSAYNGGKTQSLNQILNGRTAESRADADLSLDEQYTTLTKRYFQTQLAVMAAFLRNEALNAIGQTDHAAQRALDVGLISQVERLEAKNALANAEYENIKALNDAELAATALQRMLRTPYPIKPTTPLFISTKPLPPLSYFQQQAKTHHPAFQKIAAKYEQAKALHQFSESNYKPTVTVFGRSEIDHDPNWIAGVSANWKLWGGINRDASTNASLAKLHQAEFSQVDVADNIMLLVEKNWQTVTNAQQNYLALNTNVELAKEMLRFRQLGFKEGVNTAVEVIQAQAALEKAKTEQAKVANDYIQALADLMQSCGTPLEFNKYMQAADVKLPAIYFEHHITDDK